MTFRDPLTSATPGVVDTGADAFTAGVRVYQDANAVSGLAEGVVAWRSGQTGNKPSEARLTSNQQTVNGALAEVGLTYRIGGGGRAGTLTPRLLPQLTFDLQKQLPLNLPDTPWSRRATLDAPLEHTDGGMLLTPAAGWANDGAAADNPLSGTQPLQLRKGSNGFVYCWGLVRRTGAATSTVTNIALVPAQFQPAPSVHPSTCYSSAGAVRVDCTTTPPSTSAVQHVAGAVAAGAYVAVRLWWPSADLTTN